jgi:hypothetical protein
VSLLKNEDARGGESSELAIHNQRRQVGQGRIELSLQESDIVSYSISPE